MRRTDSRSLRWTGGTAATLVALAVAVSVPGARASGQEAQPATVIELQTALSMAAEHSPRYRRALNTIQLAEPESRQAWGSFLPTLNASLGTSQFFRRETQALDFFGNPIENPQTETVFSSQSQQGLSLGVDLFRGGARFHELGQARAQGEARRSLGERELNAVLAGVHRQFLEAQKQRQLLGLEEELLAARQRDLEMTQRLFDLTTKNRSDLLGTQLEVETQRAAVRRVIGEYEKALLSLRTAIGDRDLLDIDVADTAPVTFDPATLDVEDLVERALSASPRVREVHATSRANQAALKGQRSTRWPSVSLNTFVGRSSFGLDQNALFDVNPEDFGGSIGLSFSIPLFQRFETSYQIATADATYRNSLEDLREMELQVEEEVRGRFLDLQTAWATLRQSATGQEIADERLRIVREEYRLAGATFEDLQAAIRTAAEARRTALEERYAFASALVDLYEAAGIVAREAGIEPSEPQDR